MQTKTVIYGQNPMLNSPNVPKVLIVEDDIQLNRLLQKGLSVANLMTISTYNLADALEVLQHENIAVIVLDLGLPDGNDWDIIDTLCAAQSPDAHPKIIIITGCDTAKLGHPTMQDYFILQKPVNVSELVRLAIQLRYGRKV